MKDNVRVEDFKEISPLVSTYELQPGKHYLVIADGKHFSFELTHALLKDLRENHPELHVFIVVTPPNAKKLKVAEENNGQEHSD